MVIYCSDLSLFTLFKKKKKINFVVVVVFISREREHSF